MISDADHVVICVLLSLLSLLSLVKCLYKFFAQFFIGLYIFWMSFKRALHTLGVSPLSDVWFTHIFSLVCGLDFHSLNSVFCEAKIFNFDKVHFHQFYLPWIIFLILYLTLSLPRPQIQIHFSRSFMFLFYI